MKKITTLLLLASLILTGVSCGETRTDSPSTGGTTEPESTEPAETELSDDLADENFGEYQFRILSSIRGQATLNAFPTE